MDLTDLDQEHDPTLPLNEESILPPRRHPNEFLVHADENDIEGLVNAPQMASENGAHVNDKDDWGQWDQYRSENLQARMLTASPTSTNEDVETDRVMLNECTPVDL